VSCKCVVGPNLATHREDGNQAMTSEDDDRQRRLIVCSSDLSV
jgi:hypothetical protein